MKVLALWLSVCLTACGSITPRSFYEGVRAQDQAQRVGSPRPEPALPSFDQYNKERARLAPETSTPKGIIP